MHMLSKKEQSKALEAEREILMQQLNEEQSKTFDVDENETDVAVIAEVEQGIADRQEGIDVIIKRLNQVDIALTMLMVGGAE